MNTLINQSSAFLRSHASQPVDWLPWGDEAFKKAALEGKPLFISIGFFGSHTCAQMSRESFSNAGIAAQLNKSFVPVLVDSTERPDVEAVYLQACKLINGSAGCPLNVFADTDGNPFLACSYIPPENSGSVPGFSTILPALSSRWNRDRKTLDSICRELRLRLEGSLDSCSAVPGRELLDAAAEQLSASHDEEYGGFGKGAKFPAPQLLLFLQRYSALTGDRKLSHIVDHSLQQMYRGGIYDHLGGGFSRFCVDREWLRPHFEKPLAENALLAYVYTEAWQNGRYPLYRNIAESTLDLILRELKSENGGFYSCLDSECGGKEGAYYLLTCDEVNSVLGSIDGKHFCECYDITPEGNCSGKNIPNLLLNNRWSLVPEGYDDFREKLRLYREERHTPAIDTLVTLSGCGTLLTALSKAAAVFEDTRYLAEAKELSDFILSVFISGDTAMRCYASGKAYGEAGLIDLAFAGLGMLELFLAAQQPEYLEAAKEIADIIIGDFSADDGGYYDWLDDGLVPVRLKNVHDGEIPSACCAAALLLRRLTELCGCGEYSAAADEAEAFIASHSGSFPAGCAFGLLGILDSTFKTRTVICVSNGSEVPPLFTDIAARYTPDTLRILKTPANSAALDAASPMSAMCTDPGFYVSAGGLDPLKV